jgi:hypothetical protein
MKKKHSATPKKDDLTVPPRWIKFIADDTEVTLDFEPMPSAWHKKNDLYSFTYTKANVNVGKSFAMGMAQINALINQKRIEFK